MDPVTLALLVIGGLAIVRPKSSSSGRSRIEPWSEPKDRESWLRQIEVMSKSYSRTYDSMPNLYQYLAVVAFIESRFNPLAKNTSEGSDNQNAARGLFGMRPRTAFREDDGLESFRSSPDVLLDGRWAFVMALRGVYSACARAHRDTLIEPDWASVRRWWAYPYLAADFDYGESHSEVNLDRFVSGIEKCNSKYGTSFDLDLPFYKVRGWKNFPGTGIILEKINLYS